MVGVPGRSKGCVTCRGRRVKCDETKPICIRCTKGGFECRGYSRTRLWHHTSTAPFPEPKPKPAHGAAEAAPLTRQTDRRRLVLSPPPELSLIAFQGDICFAFMFTNFVWRAYGTPWLDQAARGQLGELATDTAKALSLANFGAANGKRDVEVQGTVLYGACLRALASRLGNCAGSGAQALLVPVLLMTMHAASQTDQRGAMFHLKGVARLLQICGPEAFQQQPLLNAFEAARATLLIAGLVGKQRLFLEQDCWRTVPWATNPASKNDQSHLLDILMVVPGMLEEHGAMGEGLPLGDELCRELLRRVEEQLVLLYQWRWEWQARWGDQVDFDCDKTQHGHEKVAASLGSTGASRRFDRLRFARFSAATDMMLYNATLMWLLALLWKMDCVGAGRRVEACAAAAAAAAASISSSGTGGIPSGHTSFAPLRRPGAAVTVHDPAMEICRAFEWVSRHHSRSGARDATVLYLFPVGMAMSVLDREATGAGAWVKELLGASPVTANYAQRQNPGGFGFYLTAGALHPEAVVPEVQLFSTNEMYQGSEAG